MQPVNRGKVGRRGGEPICSTGDHLRARSTDSTSRARVRSWQPIGSLPAAVATLVLSAIHQLRGVPLNPVITYAPFARNDDLALERGVRVSRVVESRKRARVKRLTSSDLPRSSGHVILN